jgi:hypothetical protein
MMMRRKPLLFLFWREGLSEVCLPHMSSLCLEREFNVQYVLRTSTSTSVASEASSLFTKFSARAEVLTKRKRNGHVCRHVLRHVLGVSRQSHSRSSSTSPLKNKTHTTTSCIPKVPMDVREQNIQKLHHPMHHLPALHTGCIRPAHQAHLT